MKTLRAFVELENTTRSLFGWPELHLDSSEGRKEVASMLRARLSPENLTCDGELRGPALRRRTRFLTNSQSELFQLDPALKNIS